MLLGEGSADGSESLDNDFDEELKVLWHVLAESQRSRDGAGSSDGGSATCATSEDGAVWKRSASLPLQRPNSKHPCVAGDSV